MLRHFLGTVPSAQGMRLRERLRPLPRRSS